MSDEHEEFTAFVAPVSRCLYTGGEPSTFEGVVSEEGLMTGDGRTVVGDDELRLANLVADAVWEGDMPDGWEPCVPPPCPEVDETVIDVVIPAHEHIWPEGESILTAEPINLTLIDNTDLNTRNRKLLVVEHGRVTCTFEFPLDAALRNADGMQAVTQAIVDFVRGAGP